MCRIAAIVLLLISACFVKISAQSKSPYGISDNPDVSQLFSSSSISSDQNEYNITFTPNGKQVYFTRKKGTWGSKNNEKSTIYTSDFSKGKWTSPIIAPFSGKHDDSDVFISPDGQKLFFTSNRPVNGNEKKDSDIWMLFKTSTGWSRPIHLGNTINSPKNEYSPVNSLNGNLYFASERDGGLGQGDLYVSRFKMGEYTSPKPLGKPINTPKGEWNICIDPHEQYIIFEASERPENLSPAGDLYISYKKGTLWETPIHLSAINTKGSDLYAHISPNGQYLFYASVKNKQQADIFKISLPYLLKKYNHQPLITNDAVVLGILLLILVTIFQTEKNTRFRGFYKYVPALLLCYFIPSVFNSLGIISGEESKLYFVSSRYLLPASLVLLTISIDFKGIRRLGSKAVIMFFAGTLGIIIGGPLALIIVSAIAPDVVGGAGPDAVWRGLTTVAGSWIGGGANQTAMKEVFGVGDKLFSAMITVDVITANIWMAFLLYGAGISAKVDHWFRADSSAIKEVQQNVENYQASIAKIPSFNDLATIMAIAFGCVAFAHFGADLIAPFIKKTAPHLAKFSLTSGFFWLIVIATTLGLLLSFTKARNYEGAGASRMGSFLLYVLIASIGMKMDITAIFNNLGLFLIGIIWMLVHVVILITVGKLIKAPFFFVAVGSQANVGGAASAPVVASAFHPSLAPVGVLLAVLGYAVGTYGAWFCGIIMKSIAE